MSVERSVFHAQMFGSQVSTQAPRFQQVARQLEHHIAQVTGAGGLEAKEKAVALIKSNVLTQAHVTAMNDAFWILGILVGVSTVLLLLEALTSYRKETT
jgi:hypothetical protein